MIFLSDGQPTESRDYPKMIEDLSKECEGCLQLATFFVGDAVGFDLLRDMASTDVTNQKMAWQVNDGEDLINTMSTYYAPISKWMAKDKVRWQRVEDLSSKQVLYSGCAAMLDKTDVSTADDNKRAVIGTVCVDANLFATTSEMRNGEGWTQFRQEIEEISRTCAGNRDPPSRHASGAQLGCSDLYATMMVSNPGEDGLVSGAAVGASKLGFGFVVIFSLFGLMALF